MRKHIYDKIVVTCFNNNLIAILQDNYHLAKLYGISPGDILTKNTILLV